MASLQDFFDGLKATLEGNAELAAWPQTHFGRAWRYFDGIFAGPVDFEAGSEDLPSITIQPDDAAAQAVVLQRTRNRVSSPMLVTFCWRGADAAAIIQQQLELPEIVLDALATNHTLGGKVTRAYLDPAQSWAWDTTELPLVMFGVRVLGEHDRIST